MFRRSRRIQEERGARWWAWGGLVALAAGLGYAGSLENGFTFDDHAVVEENRLVRESSWAEIFTRSYWGGTGQAGGGLYRPLTIASFALERRVHGNRPAGYHLVNLLLHAAASVGLYLMGSSLIGPRGGRVAGLLFALHPGSSEAVDSLVGRAELLSFCWGLLGAWLWLRGGGRKKGYLLAGMAALLAAQLSKESGACFGAGLALCEFVRRRGGSGSAKEWALPLVPVCAGLGAKWGITGTLGPGAVGFLDNPLAYADPLVRSSNGIRLLVKYLLLLAYPWPLSADYSFDQIPLIRGAASPGLWIPLLFLCLLGASVGAAFRVWRLPVFWLWGGISGGALLLAGNVMAPIGTIFAERLLYLPAAGFCLGVGWAVSTLDRRTAVWVMALWLSAAGGLVRLRTAEWRSDLSLFESASKISPRSARVHYGLGRALHERGRFEEAVGEYDRALRIYPRYAEACFNKGAALLSLGREEEAAQAYCRAADLRPGYGKALYACAAVLQDLGRLREAEQRYRELLRWDPEHRGAMQGLSGILRSQGRTEEAAGLLRR